MDFDLTDEQRLIADSVNGLIGDRYGFEARKGFRAEPEGWSRAMWAQFAELGLLGLPFSEDDGGFGGGPVETGLVMEAFGRALVVEPYLASVVQCGGLLRHLAANCPWNRWRARKYEPRCGVRLTDWDHARPALDMPSSRRPVAVSHRHALTLADHPGPTLAIVCRPCNRRGVLNVARLIAWLGADTPLPSVLSRVSAECPGRREVTPRCQAVFETPIGIR